MPSKLKSLEIDNWKSLRNVCLDFEDVNVLIGPNGSGKSNIVQFFHMLNMMMSGSLQLFVGRAGGANSLLHYGAKTSLFIDSKLTFVADNATDTYSFRLIHGAPDTFVFASENVEFKLHNHTGAPFKKEFGAGHKESELDTQRAKEHQVFSVVRAMLSRCRYFQFHDTSNESFIRGTTRQDTDRFLAHNGGNTAAILLRLQNEFPDAYHDVLERVRAAIPAFRDFVLEPQGGHLRLDWLDSHRGQQFGPHQLSDGSVRLIALHTLLVLPEQMSPAVIIIDEPELGLFPRAIETLVEAIRSASERSQIILATQSNRLVRYLKPASLICCAWRDGVSEVQRLSPAEQFEFMDGYTLGDYMER